MINRLLFNSTHNLAKEVAQELEKQAKKIVFAESCTAGLVAAQLAQFSGISKWLCGSAVTYQESLKTDWLELDSNLIQRHTAVSPQVTEQMAESVLRLTPSADFSVAVTGHLESDATDQGPLVFISVGYRKHESILCTKSVRYLLKADTRCDRQWEAALATFNAAIEYLRFPPSDDPDEMDWTQLYVEPTNIHWGHWI